MLNIAGVLHSIPDRRGCNEIDAIVRIFHTADYQNRRELTALRRAHPRDLFVHESREVPVIFPADIDPVYMRQVRSQLLSACWRLSAPLPLARALDSLSAIAV